MKKVTGRTRRIQSYMMLSLAIAAWLAMPVYADGNGRVVTRDIIVQATRAEEEAKYESQQTSIITSKEIEKKQAKSVEDANNLQRNSTKSSPPITYYFFADTDLLQLQADFSRQYTAWSRPSTPLVFTANTIGDRHRHICRKGLSNPVTVIYCKMAMDTYSSFHCHFFMSTHPFGRKVMPSASNSRRCSCQPGTVRPALLTTLWQGSPSLSAAPCSTLPTRRQ